MHFYINTSLGILTNNVNTNTNVINLTGFNNFFYSIHKTPFNLIGNTSFLRNGSNDANYLQPSIHDAVLKVFFKQSSGNILKNKLYYIRTFSATSFAIFESAQDASQDNNRVSLAGFLGGTMAFPNKTYPPRRAKSYQINEECCGIEYKTTNVPNTCTVTFDGNAVVCRLTNGGGWKHNLFSGSLDNYQTSDGSTADLGFLVTVYHDGTSASNNTFGSQTGIQIKVGCGLYYLKNGTPVFDSSSTYSRALQNHASFDLSGTVSEVTTYHPNGPGWDGITTLDYEFSGSVTPPSQMRVKLPNARFLGTGGPSVGNIDEILTFDPVTCSYVSDQKNYYEIPGRLTAELDFYPTVISEYKFIGNLSPIPFSNSTYWPNYLGTVGFRFDNLNNIDTSHDVWTLTHTLTPFNYIDSTFHVLASTMNDSPAPGFQVGDLYFDINLEKIFHYGIVPKIIIGYSRSQSFRNSENYSLGPKYYFTDYLNINSFSFFKADRFFIYSDDANAMISSYRLND
jgi:hypothetical protein